MTDVTPTLRSARSDKNFPFVSFKVLLLGWAKRYDSQEYKHRVAFVSFNTLKDLKVAVARWLFSENPSEMSNCFKPKELKLFFFKSSFPLSTLQPVSKPLNHSNGGHTVELWSAIWIISCYGFSIFRWQQRCIESETRFLCTFLN